MKTLTLIAGMDWHVLGILCLALIAVLVFLGSILMRARKIDLPFMHVFMATVTRKRKPRK